jgi:hypothetical protein
MSELFSISISESSENITVDMPEYGKLTFDSIDGLCSDRIKVFFGRDKPFFFLVMGEFSAMLVGSLSGLKSKIEWCQ